MPHLNEGCTLLVKASLRSLSAKDTLVACRTSVMALYAGSASLISIVLYMQTRPQTTAVTVIFHVWTLLFQQSNRPLIRRQRINTVVDEVWRLSFFLQGCWISARLVESLSRGHVDGSTKGNLDVLARYLTLYKDVYV